MKFKIRFVDPQKQYHDHQKEFLKTFDNILSHGDLIMRKDLKNFEKKIAKFVGTKYAIGVSSGTAALSFSMEAAGIKPGDEVITVAHTFMASISAIHHQKAKAVLIDVGQDFNMNPDLIEKMITSKTKAIEPVHLNGRVADMEKIMAIAKKYNLIVIEDAAQALGAKIKYHGKWKMAGSFGLTGCFSMYPFKMLGAFGDAGVVTTNDAKIARKIRLLRYNGEDRQDRKFYFHGYTGLLDNVQAAFLNVKLKYFQSWLKRRREIAELYYQGLKNVPQVKLPYFKDSRFYDVYQNYAILAQRRNQLKKYLEDKAKIETLVSWPVPMYKQPIMQPNKIHLPETEKICKEVISLPMYPELTNQKIRGVIENIKTFYKKI